MEQKEQIVKELFENYYECLCDFIEDKIGDKDEARNIVTEAFKYLWDEFHNVGITDSKKLLELLSTKSLEGGRAFLKEKKKRQEAVKKIVELLKDAEINAEEIILARILNLLAVEEGNLTERQKQALHLFFSKVKGEEAAGLMDIEPSTYRNTKSQALKKLRLSLIKAGYYPISLLLMIGITLYNSLRP